MPQAGGRIGFYLVGARDGYANAALPPPSIDDTFNVFFEADESAIPQIQQRNDPATSRVFPICLSDRNGPATFYANYDPFTSSLLKIEPGADYSQWYDGRDYPFSQALRCVREIPVETRTLDSLRVLDDPDVAPPTVIALDTQGSELAILLGGRDLIAEHTMAIVTEAEFVRFYEGQPLFGDICARLDELGFTFVDFAFGPYKIDAFAAPLGLRSKPQIGFADAFFMRKPALLDQPLQLAQLAVVAILYGHVAVGFQCLDLLKAKDRDLASIPAERHYRTFLRDLDAARAQTPVLYAPTFDDMYPTYERSAERFERDVTHDTLEAHYLEGAGRIRARLVEQESALQAMVSLDSSPVEACLRGYGFEIQAHAVKERRLADAVEMCRRAGIAVGRETKVMGTNDPGT